MEQKFEKMLLVFQIVAFELGVANSHNIEQDTYHPHSMCLKAAPRFNLTLEQAFSKATFLEMMKRHDKSALMEILQVFETVSHADCQSVF